MLAEYRVALTRRRLSPNTIRLRIFYIEKIAEQYGTLDLTLDQLEGFVAAHANWSQNTQQTAISSLRCFYKWEFEAGLRADDPSAELLRIKVRQPKTRIANDPSIRAGLDNGNSEEQAMILLGAECGFRVSEIASLHRDCRDGEWLTIVGKGQVERSVQASPELVVLLDRIERESMRWDYYFPGRSGGHIHPSTVWRHLKRLTGFNPHALRHRAGTTVYRNSGKDLRLTQVFLGHARPETTAIYVHVEREDLAVAAAASRMAA